MGSTNSSAFIEIPTCNRNHTTMDSLPELPLQDIRDTIEEQLKGLPDEFEKKEKELRSEWELHKRRDADYPIKNTKGDGLIATLKKNDQESRLHEVAGMLILEGDFADKVAEKVVEKVQPKITELKPAMMPGFIWGKIEEKLKAKIEDMVSDSVKVSIESFLRSKGCTDVQVI